VAEGDQNAFCTLFRLYANDLASFILRITESKPLTEEIVQDVFLKIWLSRSNLRDIHSFRAYLFTVARNHTFNCLKQIAREKTKQQQWLDSVLNEAHTAQEPIDTPDPAALVETAVDLLPPQQKKIYTLSRQHGLKQAEIAAALNISLETVKKHMVLAIRFLKNHLSAQLRLLLLALSWVE
jgi:RNA polymerase sigma-70 factor (family 1)